MRSIFWKRTLLISIEENKCSIKNFQKPKNLFFFQKPNAVQNVTAIITAKSESGKKSPDSDKENEPRKFPMRPPAKSQELSKSPTFGNDLISNEVKIFNSTQNVKQTISSKGSDKLIKIQLFLIFLSLGTVFVIINIKILYKIKLSKR